MLSRAEREDRWVRRCVVAGVVFIVFGLGLIGWVTETHAAPFGPAEETAYAEAVAYWGHEPALCAPLIREVVPMGSLNWGEPGIMGRATQPEIPSTECHLQIVGGLPPSELCVLMTHEYGHLLGYGHSTDPANIMFPTVSPSAAPICQTLYRSERLAENKVNQRRHCLLLRRGGAAERQLVHCWAIARSYHLKAANFHL